MKTKNALLSLSALFFLSAFQAASGQLAPPPWQWAQQYGGENASANATRIAVDDSGSSYLIGTFSGTAQFGSTSLTSSGWQRNLYLVKTNASGDVLWAKSAGGSGTSMIHGVSVDAEGNCYITGSFEGDLAFGDLVLAGDFNQNMFLAKYDASGQLQWARSGGGSGSDSGLAVAVDADGNPYVTGHFTETVAFGTLAPLNSAGWHDIFVVAYTAAGDERWAVRAGGTGFGHEAEGGRGLAVDAAGDVYVAGNFVGTATFGTHSLHSAGSQDAFIAKYSPATGAWTWASRGGGIGEDFASGLELGENGNVFVTGIFADEAAFGDTALIAQPGLSWINRGYFVADYTSSGTLLWAQASAGVGSYAGHGIAVDPSNNVYLVATFDGTMTIGGTAFPSAGYDNIYVRKFDAGGTSQWVVQSAGDMFNIAADIGIDASGSLYLAGWFLGTAEFGETILAQDASTEISVAKMGVAAAPIPIVAVDFDIRPGSCKNPLQPKSRGKLPVAILGGEDFSIAGIDLSTVTIWRADGVGGAASPLAKPAPVLEDVVECGESEADEFSDLALTFSVAEMVELLELRDLPRDSEVELVISGELADGREFAGIDVVWLR